MSLYLLSTWLSAVCAVLSIKPRNTATKDCPLVQLIRSLGGIPFCKTNVPQTMMSLQVSGDWYKVARVT